MGGDKEWDKLNTWDPGWNPEDQPEHSGIMEMVYKEYGLTKRQPRETFTHLKRMEKEQIPFLVGEVSEERVELSPEEATEKIKTKALEVGADLVGITKMQPGLVFRGHKIAGPYAIVVVKEMDFDKIATAPGPEAGIEATHIYAEVGEIGVKVAQFVRSLGYPARAHHPRSFEGKQTDVLFIPLAVNAGLGELGRHGLIVTEEFGPRMRIGAVSTQLELVPDEPRTFGVDEYCRKCTKCFRVCPAGAIAGMKSVQHGIEKFRTQGMMCAPYFAATDGCAICIKECDFNKPRDELKKMMDDLRSKS